MGLLRYDFHSVILGCSTSLTITIPEVPRELRKRSLAEIFPEGMKIPTVYNAS